MRTLIKLSAFLAALGLTQWACSQRNVGQVPVPQRAQNQAKTFLRTNRWGEKIAKDPRATVELYLKDYKRPQRELDSIVVPSHVPIGQFLNRDRYIHGYYLNDDLILYAQPDPHSPIVFRDSAYKWSGNSELSGDGYLVRSKWRILEYTPQWVKVHYHNATGWLNGSFFATNKIVVFDMSGNRFQEFLSPFISSGIYTIVAGDDITSIFVSNYKDFFFKIDFFTGQVLDTVRVSYLIDRGLLKRSYIHTYLHMSEEDFVLLDKMQFYPGTFQGRFLQDRVIYIYKNTEFDNVLLSEDYQTGKIDTLFHFQRLQLGIAYQIEFVCPMDKYVVMPMDAYDARY